MTLGRILLNTLALLLVFFVVWDVRGNDVVIAALVMALVLALVNTFIRPVVLLLTLPVSILTFGLFALLVNAAFFYMAARLVHVHVGFGRAFLGYILYVAVSAGLGMLSSMTGV
ncbi:MAG: phage holin family protein [Candidatus Dormibacteria bacterium]